MGCGCGSWSHVQPELYLEFSRRIVSYCLHGTSDRMLYVGRCHSCSEHKEPTSPKKATLTKTNTSACEKETSDYDTKQYRICNNGLVMLVDRRHSSQLTGTWKLTVEMTAKMDDEKRNLDVWALHHVIPQQKNAKYNHLNLWALWPAHYPWNFKEALLQFMNITNINLDNLDK